MPGPGGKWACRRGRTHSLNTITPRFERTRSAITVAGIISHTRNCSRIRGSNASTVDPAGFRTYFGGTSAASALRTVLRETLTVLANILIGTLDLAQPRTQSNSPLTTFPISLPRVGAGTPKGSVSTVNERHFSRAADRNNAKDALQTPGTAS